MKAVKYFQFDLRCLTWSWIRLCEKHWNEYKLKSKWKLSSCLNNQNYSIKNLSSFCHIQRIRIITCNCDDREVWTRNFFHARAVKVLLQNHLWLLNFGILRILLLWFLFYLFIYILRTVLILMLRYIICKYMK